MHVGLCVIKAPGNLEKCPEESQASRQKGATLHKNCKTTQEYWACCQQLPILCQECILTSLILCLIPFTLHCVDLDSEI